VSKAIVIVQDLHVKLDGQGISITKPLALLLPGTLKLMIRTWTLLLGTTW
jgi:hypothetical protein